MNKRRIPELDGLRVLMIFIVAWYHIWQQSWLMPVIQIPALGIDYSLDWLARSGYVWVDGTVLLSVFLLYLPWAEAKREKAPMPKAGDFYFRRAKRVIPAYYFIVLCHLLIVALPWGLYDKSQDLIYRLGSKETVIQRDLFSHLTFTFTFFTETYQRSQLGGAAWTLAILVQGYVLFPVIGRGMRKQPVITLLVMMVAGWGYRIAVILEMSSYDMVVNQLINFMDVYVIGILCATGFLELREKSRGKIWEKSLATAVFFGSLCGLALLLQYQSGLQGGTVIIQKYQMMLRPVYGLCFAGMIMSAPFSFMALRKVLGNRVTKFLAGISMNFYLIHQTVAVHLKSRLQVPWPLPETLHYGPPPEWMKDTYYWDWQKRYTWICFGVALVMATAVTYLVEKPGARLFDFFRKKWRKEA